MMQPKILLIAAAFLYAMGLAEAAYSTERRMNRLIVAVYFLIALGLSFVWAVQA